MPDGAKRRFKHYYMPESAGIAVGIFLASITHAGLAAHTHTRSPMAYVVIPVGYPAENATIPKHALVK